MNRIDALLSMAENGGPDFISANITNNYWIFNDRQTIVEMRKNGYKYIGSFSLEDETFIRTEWERV
jgi:hypothetical protein